MMVPAEDDEDEFFVPTVVETGESDAPTESWRQYGLKKLGGFVFAKTSAGEASSAEEEEPTLPAGFSATLNAEEEEIYPAEAKIKVLVAEGSLSGRNRRQAAELHQALQQVVGAAAIYNHLLTLHGGVGTRPKSGGDGDARSASGSVDGAAAAVGKSGRPAICDCGGGVGSCKAISSLLKDEMDKVAAGAESERRGAMLKKFRQVERRSGGLCNPDLLEKVVRSSSTDGGTATPMLSEPQSTPLPPLHSDPREEPGPAAAEAAGASASNLVVVDVEDDAEDASTPPAQGSAGVGANASATQDIPWAEDMLCRAVRKRHAEMLRTRGRALARGLARMLKGVSKDLKGVASRLPPWEEEDCGDEPGAQDEAESLSRIQSRGNVFGSPTHGRSSSQGSYASLDPSDDAPAERLSSPSSDGPSGGGVSGRPPMPYSSATSTVVAAAAAAAAAVVAPVAMVASAVVPTAASTRSGGVVGSSSSSNTSGAADEIKSRRQDWKLDAQELSLIRKEEERVMKPDVLARLLAKGAGMGCLQQADFWDVFARLEVATRTEALLNIAIRGGRGCAARSGRMGRELCISLTSVVLEAINTVEQAQRKSQIHSTAANISPSSQQQQQQQQQRRNSRDGANPEDGTLQAQQQQQPEQAAGVERKRPSSERLSRGALGGADPASSNGARARAGSEVLPAPARLAARGESVAGAAGATRKFYKEDPGLKDLDRREEEFRKAIYVHRRALATRFLRLTNDAPLCSQVLGTFVDDRAKSATPPASEAQPRPRSIGRVASDSAKKLASRFASSPGGFSIETGNPPVPAEEAQGGGPAPVDLTSGDNTPTSVDNINGNPATTPTPTTTTPTTTIPTPTAITSKQESGGATGGRSCTDSHPSPSVSVGSSSNTEPLSEGAEDSSDGDTARPSSASTSPWGQQQDEEEQQKSLSPAAAGKAGVAEIYQVSDEDPVEVETLLI